MSKVARIVKGVDHGTLKVFNRKEIQELYGKLSDGDIVVDESENMYIWPNTMPFVSEKLQDRVFLEILVMDTEKHKNAIEFFKPIIKHYENTLLVLRLNLQPSDEGLVATFGENALNSSWKIVAMFGDKLTYECYFYDCGRRHVFVNRDFINSGYTDLCEFWHACYDRIFDAEIMVLFCVEQLAYERLKSTLAFYPKKQKFHTDYIEFFSKSVQIGNDIYKFNPNKNLFFVMFRIAARDYVPLESCLKLSEIQYKLCAKTEPDVFWRRVPYSKEYVFAIEKNDSNILLRKKKRHQILVDICLAFADVLLPYYIYDIVCFLRCFEYSNRYINVAIIEGVFASIRKVWAQRDEKEKKLKT